MSGSHIGIKIADGSFYPIFDKNARGKKRLVLTTAHENQQTVQISLYQGDDTEDADYVGTLVVENIAPVPKGAAEINLVIGIDESGNLVATATDTASGEYQSLSVSLASIDEESLYPAPDFSLEEEEHERFAVEPVTEPDDVESAAMDEDSFTIENDLSPDELEEAFEFDEEALAEPQAADSAATAAVTDADRAVTDTNLDEESDLDLGLADDDDADFNFDLEDEEPRIADDFESTPFDSGAESDSVADSWDEAADSWDEVAEDAADEQPVHEVHTGFTEKLEPEATESGTGAVLFLGFILLALAALGFLTYIIFRAIESPDIPPLEAGLPLLAVFGNWRVSRIRRWQRSNRSGPQA